MIEGARYITEWRTIITNVRTEVCSCVCGCARVCVRAWGRVRVSGYVSLYWLAMSMLKQDRQKCSLSSMCALCKTVFNRNGCQCTLVLLSWLSWYHPRQRSVDAMHACSSKEKHVPASWILTDMQCSWLSSLWCKLGVRCWYMRYLDVVDVLSCSLVKMVNNIGASRPYSSLM